jgi:hypothetical protein
MPGAQKLRSEAQCRRWTFYETIRIKKAPPQEEERGFSPNQTTNGR